MVYLHFAYFLSPCVYNIAVIALIRVFLSFFPLQNANSILGGFFLWHIPSDNFFLDLFFAIIIVDLESYFVHLYSHKYFWNLHKMHHYSSVVNWLLTEAGHPFLKIPSVFLYLMSLYCVGFSHDVIAFSLIFRSIYSNFVHIESDIEYRFGLQYIFVSPRMHASHHLAHGSNLEKLVSKNIGMVFSCWDVLFKSYEKPEKLNQPIYGIDDKIYPDNYFAQLGYIVEK